MTLTYILLGVLALYVVLSLLVAHELSKPDKRAEEYRRIYGAIKRH